MPHALVQDSLSRGLGEEGVLSLLIMCSDGELHALLDLVLRRHASLLGTDERYRRAPRRPARYPDLIAAGLGALAAKVRTGWLGRSSAADYEDMARHFAGLFQIPTEGVPVAVVERQLLDQLAVRDEASLKRALARLEWAELPDAAECVLRVSLLRRSKWAQLGLPWPPSRPVQKEEAPARDGEGWFSGFMRGAYGSLDDLLDVVPGGENAGLARLRHCNVFVAGRSGAGKTTLVNAVFGQALGKAGSGRPMTQQATWYEHPTRPLRVCDTRGLERGQFHETIDALHIALTDLRANPDPAIQPHVAWLCIDAAGSKIEPGEQRLAKLLAAFDIPVICVLTKSWMADDLSSHVPGLLPEAKVCIRVLAEKKAFSSGVAVAQFGLEELVAATLEVLPEGVQQAFAAVQAISLEPKVKAARRVITASAGLAASAAAIPIPFSDAFVLAPIQIGMIVGISRAVGLDMREDAAKPLISAALGVTMASFGGRMLASGLANLAKMVPGIGSVVGASINGTVAVAVTRMLGEAYLEFLTGHVRKTGRLPTVDEAVAYFQDWWVEKKAREQVEA